VWLSLSQPSFARFHELYEDVSREPGEAFFGWLCSAMGITRERVAAIYDRLVHGSGQGSGGAAI
jgi:hypothetical protein